RGGDGEGGGRGGGGGGRGGCPAGPWDSARRGPACDPGFGATTASSGPHRTPRCTILHHGDSRAALTLNRGVNVRILLAGGAGFVGSHLAARLLDAGHQLAIVDNLITGRAANLYALEKRYPGAHLEIEIEDACALTR